MLTPRPPLPRSKLHYCFVAVIMEARKSSAISIYNSCNKIVLLKVVVGSRTSLGIFFVHANDETSWLYLNLSGADITHHRLRFKGQHTSPSFQWSEFKFWWSFVHRSTCTPAWLESVLTGVASSCWNCLLLPKQHIHVFSSWGQPYLTFVISKKRLFQRKIP